MEEWLGGYIPGGGMTGWVPAKVEGLGGYRVKEWLSGYQVEGLVAYQNDWVGTYQVEE